MRYHLDLETVCKRFAVLAIAAAAFSVLFISAAEAQAAPPPPPPPPTTWTITVDVSSGNEKPSYTVSPPANGHNCAGTNPHPVPSAEYLYICPGDTVQWEVKTKGGNGKLSVYQKDKFLYKGATSTQWFHTKEGQPPDSGTTQGNAAKGTEHEYCIAAFDDDSANPHLFVHDPKIVIGTGNREEALINSIIDEAQQLQGLLHDASDTVKNQAQQLIDQAETLKRLIDLSRPQK